MEVQTDLTTTSYHNTLNLSGEELKRRELKAGSQDATVLDFFTTHPPYKFTASQVTNQLHQLGHRFLKDSVKRAISNLSSSKDKLPYLRRTKTLVPGPHGSPEHLYELIR